MYEKVFPLAPYVNEKIGIEVEVRPGDDPGQEFVLAKTTVERWHKEGNPLLRLNFTSPGTELPVIQKDNDDKMPGISINDILSCNSLVVLDAYRGIIKDNIHLMMYYKERRAFLVREGLQ